MATKVLTAHCACYQAPGEIPLFEVADPGLIGRAFGLDFVVLPRPFNVETPCGRVPLRPDGRTRHGFLLEDAWKDLAVEQARRAMLERTMERLAGTLAP